MNKIIGHIGLRTLVVAAALLLQPGCVKTIQDDYDLDVPLVFDPVIYTPTKAFAPSKGLYPEGQELSVSMWNYPVGEAPSDKSDQWLRDALVQKNSDSDWIPVPAAMWPKNTLQSAFLASSPYGKATATDLTDGVQFLDFDTVADQTDILYTDLAAGLTKFAGGVVNLPFKHALAVVDFQLRISNAEDGETAFVTSVSMDGVASHGSFRSLPTPAWNLDGTRAEISFFDGEQELELHNIPVGESRLILPQTLSAYVRVTLRHEDYDHTLVSDLVTLRLEAGRHYTLTLSCMLDSDTLRLDVLDDIL